jgi:hypothetical protein
MATDALASATRDQAHVLTLLVPASSVKWAAGSPHDERNHTDMDSALSKMLGEWVKSSTHAATLEDMWVEIGCSVVTARVVTSVELGL